MSAGDAPSDEDKLKKPPAAVPAYRTEAGPQFLQERGSPTENAAQIQEEIKDEPKIDEFGLPIKPPRRRHSNDNFERENGPNSNGNALAESLKADLNNINDKKERPISNQAKYEEPVPKVSPTCDHPKASDGALQDGSHSDQQCAPTTIPGIPNSTAVAAATGVSGWSHQALAPHAEPKEDHPQEEEWQDMPALAPYDLYDDDGRLIARQVREEDQEVNAYAGLGGAGKGYTRVQVDEDALSATSMDDNTSYLFKPKDGELVEDEDEQRDPLAQMQATKDLLTEGQRIAYVGLSRLAMASMFKETEDIEGTKGTKNELRIAMESMKMWSQQMMVRLYSHMEIDSSEQIMIEQLAEHGVQPGDLTRALMQNARVKNPMAESEVQSMASPRLDSEEKPRVKSPPPSKEGIDTEALPAYKHHDGAAMPEVRTPSQLPTSKSIDIDLRWTVLCDLFLLLIADSIYDARSRTLLEWVGKYLEVSWLDICRFEKRVTDSLEMQEAANKETWNEAEHMENRRKLALKRRYMMMGLATVGGSLVIGLSAGLLAPVIGAGLAAGFTTIGVAGTSGFLAGAGGTALITSGAVVTGGTIAVRASNRRTGAVKTFEYRPLHNNKRVNLVVTVSGWMNGKIDDVRLPFSTVDPIMGDIYSVLWEPEMLQSMGDTINILATEALTQGLQQVLGSTILVALMASLQLPIVLTKLSYLIDNPWTVSMARANSAGLILADSLIDRNLGVRPITLIGFSLGARVIFSCLHELANKGAFGLVQNVYLFGSPIVAKRDEYLRARMVVSGRLVNGYASNDWILGYLFRATSGGIMRVAGLAPVENIPGLENIDVTKLVNGHMAYRAAMPRLLREVGWEVESDEFTEIEDPDPENHDKRQRELIRELDEARKEAEAKPEKRRFGLFKRGKLAEKKGWETYDDSMRNGGEASSHNESTNNVLFDVDAIRAELASEQIEVRQLESTLPPMKLEINGAQSSAEWKAQNPYSTFRETKSYDESMAFRPKADVGASQASLPNSSRQVGNPFNQGYDEYNVSVESNFPSEKMVSSQGNHKASTESLDASQWPSESRSQSRDRIHDIPENRPSFERPPLPSSTTLPAGTSGLSLEHNAWLDEDDDDFGKEREVKMTFG